MLTADYTGVVAMSEDIWSESEDNWLLVLEAADGTTRYGLQYMSSRPIVPVIKDDVVQEVLRLTDDLRVERLSLKDGLVMGSANLGIASLSFAVSDRAGKVYLVADGSGQVVLWNTDSDERTVLRSTAVAAESVAFARFRVTVRDDGFWRSRRPTARWLSGTYLAGWLTCGSRWRG